MDKKVFWTQQIDRILEEGDHDWAAATLRGIRETIQRTENVTDNQIQAIKNIKWGKNDD